MRSERLTEFSVYLDNRPGEMAGVLDAVAAAGVEIRSLAVHDANGRGAIRIIGTPVGSLRSACERLVETGAGPATEAEVLAVPMTDRPNLFRDAATGFADARVNVLYAYLAPASSSSPPSCVFRVDEIDAAAEVIEGLH